MERVRISPTFSRNLCSILYAGPLSFWWVCRRRQFPEKAPALPRSRARSSCVCPTRSTSRSIKPASLPPHTHSAFYREDRPKCGKRAINGRGNIHEQKHVRFSLFSRGNWPFKDANGTYLSLKRVPFMNFIYFTYLLPF